MKLSTTIVGLARRIVKAIESWVWYRAERAALRLLAQSHRHITPGTRLRRAYSDALHKGSVIPIVPQAMHFYDHN